MNCAICQRPLLEGATACVVCGAPVQAPVRSSLPGGPPPVAFGGGAPAGPPPIGTAPDLRMSIPSAIPGSAAPGSGGYAPAPYPYAAPPPQTFPQVSQPAYAPPPQPYAPPPGYAPYAVVPYGAQPNNMAIASFVCSLLGLIPLWIGFVLCILAITFGVIGIQRSAQLPGQRGRGFAIAGLVIGVLCLPLAACGL